MTPLGFVIVVVMVIVFTWAILYDRKKSNEARSEVDAQFEGRHVADFSIGYIADNTLVIKNFQQGYVVIDLTQAAKVGSRAFNGMTNLLIYGSDNKLLPECKKLKSFTIKQVDEAIDAILINCDWITGAFKR